MKNRNTISKTILVGLASLAFLQRAQAVNPPLTPDPGPKPVSNTADGQNALLSITTGIHNTAIGFDSLLSNTVANFNTGVGSATLLLNNGVANTAIGVGALLSNTTGTENTANGAFALFNNNSGSSNTAAGFAALQNSVGSNNTADGHRALWNNTTGNHNTGIGYQALHNNTTGFGNTALGHTALFNHTGGGFNTVLGTGAGTLVTSASNVICIGQNVPGEDLDNSTYIGNINTTAQQPLPGKVDLVTVDLVTGKLGHAPAVGAFEAQAETIGQLQKQLAALTPTLQEQAAPIQQVSAQIEPRRPEPKFVKGR